LSDGFLKYDNIFFKPKKHEVSRWKR